MIDIICLLRDWFETLFSKINLHDSSQMTKTFVFVMVSILNNVIVATVVNMKLFGNKSLEILM